MARDPGSLWSPLAENGNQGQFPKDKFIVHSTGDRGTAEAIYRYSNRKDIVVESTFVVGLGPEDPTRQLLDSSSLADANVAANKSGISVEVVGTGADDYTDWQRSEIIRLGRWSHDVHGIPHQIIPDPNGAGYGWHVMFGAPGPWAGVAKVCPGPVRITELRNTIFPAIFAGATPEGDWFDMATREDLRTVINEAVPGLVTHVLRTEGVSGAGDAPLMLDRGYRDGVHGVVTAVLRTEGVSGAGDYGRLADALTAALAARPAGPLTREDVEAAVKSAFASAFA